MKKASHQTDRQTVSDFQQIVNIGPAIAEDLQQELNLAAPQKLIGADPLALYQRLCRTTGVFHDPCVLDCFLSAVDYMNGNPPRSWWEFTGERKIRFTKEIDNLRDKYPRCSS